MKDLEQLAKNLQIYPEDAKDILSELDIQQIEEMITKNPDLTYTILTGMNNDQLSYMLINHPDLADDIFSISNDLIELYQLQDTVEAELINDNEINDDYDAQYSYKVRQALSKISSYINMMESYEEQSLKDREEELAKLEAEEQIISEAEALIDKQTEKEGHDKGE